MVLGSTNSKVKCEGGTAPLDRHWTAALLVAYLIVIAAFRLNSHCRKRASSTFHGTLYL